MQANILGIELNNDFSQISYYDEQIDEVVTYKTVTGEEQIPMAISYFDDQWEIGNKAMEIYKDYPDKVSKDIFNFAISRSMVYQGGIKYPAVVLLTHYIEKLLAKFSSTEYLTFVVSDANIDTTGMLISIGTRLGINKNKIFVIDNKEAFCRYMLYQPKELWQYESALFTCDEKEMKAYMLKSIKPDLDKQREFIIVDKVGSARLDELNAIKPFVANLNKTADESFTDFVKSIFDKKVISSVFLTGVGFEDQWYPETLKYINNGLRSFIGNNLFSKGGVYLSYSKK
ncbi:MAG: DUF5716 family protein, partial [Lachnospiraceae bacterium]|nr:DUF5716 family protein [Lachnospiraceae bacterium]